MLASEPGASDQHESCLSCGPACKRQRKQRLPKSLFQNLRLKLLSIWSKVEPNRRRDSSTAVSPIASRNHQYFSSSPMVSTPLPKSIDFTQFESPYSEIVECHGLVVPLGERPKYKELSQAIAPRPSLSDDYTAACVNGALYCTIYHSEFENYPDDDNDDNDDDDEGYFERTFRRMEVGDRRCFSFEIQSSVMDHAYFVSEFSKGERAEKMGKADPVNHTEIWEAERIVRHVRKVKSGKTLFLVEWSGRQPNGRPWPKTWEPAENLGPVLLNLYEQETGLIFSRDD